MASASTDAARKLNPDMLDILGADEEGMSLSVNVTAEASVAEGADADTVVKKEKPLLAEGAATEAADTEDPSLVSPSVFDGAFGAPANACAGAFNSNPPNILSFIFLFYSLVEATLRTLYEVAKS